MSQTAVEPTPADSTVGAMVGRAELEAHARQLAARIPPVPTSPNIARHFLQQLEENARVIERAYDITTTWSEEHPLSSPAAEWLLDNFYIVRDQIRDIREYLPRHYFRELPKLADGRPRVYLIALELVNLCDCALDEELILRFIDQFQHDAELTIGETWAVPIMLRIALLERLRDICGHLINEQRAVEEAESILRVWDTDHRLELPDAESQLFPITVNALSEAIQHRVHHEAGDVAGDAAHIHSRLDDHLQRLGRSVEELRKFDQHRLATQQITTANIITSMRLVETLDWVDFFEAANRAERMLRHDPAGVYARMDFSSRNRYRDVVEELSKRSHASETAVARQAIELAERVRETPGEGDDSGMREVRHHIGYWIVDEGRSQLEQAIAYRAGWRERLNHTLRRHPHWIYFGGLAAAVTLLVAALATVLGPFAGFAGLVILALVPLSEVAVIAMNALVTLTAPVRLLPKMDFRNGIPPRYPTFVVIPAMLTSRAEVESLLANLENHYLADADPQFSFALLTDFADSDMPVTPRDDEFLQHAVQGVRKLNSRYSHQGRRPFFLFHRQRRWNPCEGKWMGWERKRGKLLEFGRLVLYDDPTSYALREGDLAWLNRLREPANTPFIVTLDADTILPRDTVRKLVGTLAHPLNRPIQKPSQRRVTRGYSVVQPRISVHMSSSNETRYLRVHAGSPGIDPYASAASDVYQDLFGEGSYTGKGIYDLRSFERILQGVFPENHILSHDLIEGGFARAALASDIELFDSYPSRYDADARRQHRWVRGDWQIAPWLLPRVPGLPGRTSNPLSGLTRWKILDNLRRSLVAPALLAFMLCVWFWLPSRAWVGTSVAALTLFFPVLVQMFLEVRGWKGTRSLRQQGKASLWRVAGLLERQFYSACFLPHRAWLMSDAIFRTLYRLLVSRRRMLEWETASATETRLRGTRWSLVLQLGVCSVVSIAALLGLERSAIVWAWPWLVAWCAAPLIGQFVCLPRPSVTAPATEEDRQWLRQIASATWAYFEHFVQSDGNWLPPDNVQQHPKEKVAQRISPTNQGMFLVSALVARRYGFVGLEAVTSLWEKSLATWLSLETFRGNHLNWYSTVTLAPLHPRYVSTVDSGNLVACYLTLATGISQLPDEPLLSPRTVQGIRDSLAWLRDSIIVARQSTDKVDDAEHQRYCEEGKRLVESCGLQLEYDGRDISSLTKLVDSLDVAFQQIGLWHEGLPTRDGTNPFRNRVRIVLSRIDGVRQDIRSLLPWLDTVSGLQANVDRQRDARLADLLDAITPDISLRGIAELPSRLPEDSRDWGRTIATSPEDLDRLFSSLRRSASAAQLLLQRLDALRDRCEDAAEKTDFRFLYNRRRKLFAIGYNLESGALDRNHYDLLCSECRLASYLAIAKGDVATEHWFSLGRQTTHIDGESTLLSWGGTMFEFLMPNLFQHAYKGSLLEMSCRTAIRRQIEYGRQRRVPWGISESAYAAIASNSDYQYRSFGVPGLGLKRGLSKDLVISPYSSALALSMTPAQAVANLRHLKTCAYGDWGFYDAVDYTLGRLHRTQERIIVRSFMAHHQGMILLAIANSTEQQQVQTWFHAHPLVRANILLLQERAPTWVTAQVPHADEMEENRPQEGEAVVSRQITGVFTATPRALFLSNEKFTSMVTHAGSGYCRYGDVHVTRWIPDATREPLGTAIYLRDMATRNAWSAAYQPTCVTPDDYQTIFAIDKAEFHRRQGDLETVMEIVVAPEHPAEVRSLRITNHGTRRRKIELTSYAEVVLASQGDDTSHPAFHKLFVETEFLPENHSLLARRRPRHASQSPLHAVHSIALPARATSTVDFESSREQFIGRCGSLERPRAMCCDRLSRTVGAVLDPIFSLRGTLVLEPGETESVGFTTAFAATREDALSIAGLYQDMRSVQRAFDLAWALARVEIRQLDLSASQVHLYQHLAGALLYPHRTLRGDAQRIAANRLPQSALWRFGVSGDIPILLVRVNEEKGLDLIRELVVSHRFLHSRGMDFDLVIVNQWPASYLDTLQDRLQAIVHDHPHESRRGKQHALRGSQLSESEQQLLEAAATVALTADGRSLAEQLDAARGRSRQGAVWGRAASWPADARRSREQDAPRHEEIRPAAKGAESGEFFNGYGGFVDDGYQTIVRLDRPTPAPWSNVIANSGFGCLITESGGGYTWFGNSRENKITTWSNDPVCDPPSECLYIHSDDPHASWSPLRGHRDQGERQVTHAPGYSLFSGVFDQIASDVLVTIHETEPIKIVQVRLHNRGTSPRVLHATYYAETVLGVSRDTTRLHQVSSLDREHDALMMTNGYHPDFPAQVVFLTAIGGTDPAWTADRASFLGRCGNWHDPTGLHRPLNETSGTGLDPCLVYQTSVTLEPGATEEIIFLLGAGENLDAARGLLKQLRSTDSVAFAIASAIERWRKTLSAVQVQTPNRALDLLVNRWLPYQVLSCRVWGRSAFYQAGGAYGFRDQLQDVMSLLHLRPDVAREHILRAAARQYLEGDVQHWWHPPAGQGTRTRFSDDFLFLPYVTHHYVHVTGDRGILDVQLPFVESSALRPEEQERYERPRITDQTATLLEHCKRSMQYALRYGRHGLPLMGCGDWNDGLNQVGSEGEGESVWLAWFQIAVFEAFAPLLRERGDHDAADLFVQQAARLQDAIQEHAWDGGWYRRAFFDDGTPLGSLDNQECQIDSLPQSWALIAKGVTERSEKAFRQAIDRLFDRQAELVLLFHPPFHQSIPDPGYIQGYVPGVRENGGQYTHAAAWMVQAATILGDAHLAMQLFNALNPIHHSDTPLRAALYKVEPYVIAADVYANPQHLGRGGWTWYTGSGGWMYRVATEFILGIRIAADMLTLAPVVPSDWSEFRFTLHRGSTQWRIHAVRNAAAHAHPNHLALVDDGRIHDVTLGFDDAEITHGPIEGMKG